MTDMPIDLLARVYYAANNISRKQAKHELYIEGFDSGSKEVDATIQAAISRWDEVEKILPSVKRHYETMFGACYVAPGYQPPCWLWCEDADGGSENRWLAYCGRGWIAIWEIVPRDKADPEVKHVDIDDDHVLMMVSRVGKPVSRQLLANVTSEAVEVALDRLESLRKSQVPASR